jgi:pimeloyl-ACP methyl ester carboxylesterase
MGGGRTHVHLRCRLNRTTARRETAGLIGLAHTQIILLPGLDGTARLFRRFIASAPPHLSLIPVALPLQPLGYGELADRIDSEVPDGPIVVIAESFAGPVAIALAERRPVAAFVFCNSFVVAPRARSFRWLASPLFFRLPMPGVLLRRYMVGATADETLVREVSDAVAAVPAEVLASRLKSVLELDARDAFGRCVAPMLYLRGTEDRLVSESASHCMAALRPMSIVPVPGPHLLLQANPAGAWRAIVPFLDGLAAV